jgi:uncharacterized protein (UPF0276 family)
MNFAINYSPQAAELFRSGQIQVDRFKCPDWPWMIEEASQICPVAVHFNLTAGNGSVRDIDWDAALRLLESTSTPYLNLHLESRRRDFPNIPADSVDPAHFEQVYEQVAGDLRIVLEHIEASRVIVENVPYRGPGGKVLRPSVEPGLIHRLLEETGCGLLFDLSHARIAAQAMGLSEHEYIARLPLDRNREMHFTGTKIIDGMTIDHLEAQENDWQALEWFFREHASLPKPWLLAFEYGGVGEKFAWRSETAVIASQAPRLYQLCHSE